MRILYWKIDRILFQFSNCDFFTMHLLHLIALMRYIFFLSLFQNNMLIPVSTVKFSEQAILALRAMKEGPRKVLLVASRSENVTIKDAQTGLLLRTLVGPKMTVYTLLFEDGKVYCGTSSHQIHVFDYSVSIYLLPLP